MPSEPTIPATVVVPVGLGGKTAPYVPDPAPTLLVDLAPSRAPAPDDGLVDVAERLAADIVAAAEADAHTAGESIVAEARGEAERIVEEASARSDALVEESQAALERRENDLADREAAAVAHRDDLARPESELAERTDDIAARESTLATLIEETDRRQEGLDLRDRDLTDRFSDADREAAEAARLVDAARNEADAILLRARQDAEAITSDAATARAGNPDVPPADTVSSTTAIDDDHDYVDRIEIQVLRDRENELLGRIAELERRLDRESEAFLSVSASDSTDAGEPDADPISDHADGNRSEHVRPSGIADGARHVDRSESDGIAAHAPLTEQLSASAFRTSADRRGRRRR